MSENKVGLLSKITVAKVYGAIPTKTKTITEDGKKRDIAILDQPVDLMRVYGQASGYRIGKSSFGESLVFKGMFKAINLETGEQYTAGECCLPKILESQLGGILEGSEGAEFGFDISAVPAKNAYGYEYRVKPLLQIAESPVISALEKKIGTLALTDKSKKKK